MQNDKDRWLEEQIEKEMTPSIEIHVDAREGSVSLTGTVDSLAEKNAAVKIAERVSDVAKVQDFLTVSMDKNTSDQDLQGMIEEKLFTLRELSGIGAEVHKGVVYLQGTAETPGYLAAAMDLVSQIPGVAGIKNRVKIKEEL